MTTWWEWLIWGIAGSLVLTAIIAGAQGLGWTRMSLPFLLGTMFTANRERAKVVGLVVNTMNGLIFALLYALLFEVIGGSVWKGAVAGAIHGFVVLTVLLPALPAFHPRMAGEHAGPTARRQLEPPGFLAMHYGRETPIAVLVGHVAYGALLGGLFRG